MSLGAGLGYGMQGQLKDYTSLYADAYKQKAALDAAKKAKKDAQDTAQMNKLLKSVWVDDSKYHRTLIDEATNTYTDVSDKLSELQSEYPNDWVARAQPLLAQTSSKLGKLRKRTVQYRMIEAMPNVADPAQKEIQERLGWANDWRSVVAMKDNTGSVVTTPEGDIVFKKQYYDQKQDPRDYAAKMLKDKSYELNQFADEQTGGKFTTVYTGSVIARDKAAAEEVAKKLNTQFPTLGITAEQIPTIENIAGQIYRNPETQKALDYFYQDKYYDYKANKEKLPPDERMADMEQSFLDDVNQRVGGSFKTTVIKNPTTKSGSGAEYNEGRKTPINSADVDMGWVDDATNKPVSYGVMAAHRQLLPPKDISLANSGEFISLKTGKKVHVGSDIYNYRTAEFDVVPVYKTEYNGKCEGYPVAKKDFASVPKDKIEYRTVLFGTATQPNKKKGESAIIPIDIAKETLIDFAGSAAKSAKLRGQIDRAEELAVKKNEELMKAKPEKTYADDEIVKIMINGKEYSAKAGDLRKKKYNDSQFYK